MIEANSTAGTDTGTVIVLTCARPFTRRVTWYPVPAGSISAFGVRASDHSPPPSVTVTARDRISAVSVAR
jgi:hypothetical protein